jgi:hypothetical protein
VIRNHSSAPIVGGAHDGTRLNVSYEQPKQLVNLVVPREDPVVLTEDAPERLASFAFETVTYSAEYLRAGYYDYVAYIPTTHSAHRGEQGVYLLDKLLAGYRFEVKPPKCPRCGYFDKKGHITIQ